MATDMLEDLRKNIWDLRPTILDDLGLVPAIRWYAQTDLEKAGINVQFDFQSDNIRLSPHLETMLFRVSQEAVNNILRHANASKVKLHLWSDQSKICLEVEDDGRGFDVERTTGEASRKKAAWIVRNSRNVSLLWEERLKISSSPGQGTRLQVYAPLLKGNSTGSTPSTTHKERITEKQT